MRALQFRAFGDPAAKLALVNLPDSRPRQGWAVIRVRAASVNPSEVGNVEGKMERTTLSRVPGRDYAGTVVQGPAEWTRSEVWRTGGEIG
jgi:NADPH:quinone reductase-like Zn-dependent oxidoreductase